MVHDSKSKLTPFDLTSNLFIIVGIVWDFPKVPLATQAPVSYLSYLPSMLNVFKYKYISISHTHEDIETYDSANDSITFRNTQQTPNQPYLLHMERIEYPYLDLFRFL